MFIKHLLGLTITLFISTPLWANPTDLSQFASQNQGARLFQDNADSFNARMALLQSAPSGSKVKIATFHFDYGETTKELTANICEASRRGVHVELLVDSKSGDRAGIDDAFDSSKKIKKSEELYQHIANCGGFVYIHNSFTDFIRPSFFGVANTGSLRLPNIMSTGDANGEKRSNTRIFLKIKSLKKRLQNVLKNKGYDVDILSFISDLQGLFLAMNHLNTVATKANSGLNSGSTPEQGITNLARTFRKLINNSLLTNLSTQKFSEVVDATRSAIFEDPELNLIREKIRIFNRLNHKKLFMVELPNNQACAIVGGRNLGDHYLANQSDSYHDGDILTCGTPQPENLFHKLSKSFNELKNDTTDKLSSTSHQNKVRSVQPNPNYNFQYPQNFTLKAAHIPKGLELPHFSKPNLLVSPWDPRGDQTHNALLRAITRETKEIYIETAYAELNGSIRRALEKAMKERNVKVHIVTNGYFISDGVSGLIRLLMAHWNQKMKLEYKDLFKIEFASVTSKRMIHFKGAGFRCQLRGGEHYRTYLMGSHNFHARSGFSDKEHVIQWKEATSSDCPTPTQDLIAYRNQYYNNYAQTAWDHKPFVKPYTNKNYPEIGSLYFELIDANRNYDDEKNSIIARGLIRTFYKVTNQGETVRFKHNDQLMNFIEKLEEGGLKDFFGFLL